MVIYWLVDVCLNTVSFVLSVRQNLYKRRCCGFSKFGFDPNDMRKRIATSENFLIDLRVIK